MLSHLKRHGNEIVTMFTTDFLHEKTPLKPRYQTL
jgi:hypothetical protein